MYLYSTMDRRLLWLSYTYIAILTINKVFESYFKIARMSAQSIHATMGEYALRHPIMVLFASVRPTIQDLFVKHWTVWFKFFFIFRRIIFKYWKAAATFAPQNTRCLNGGTCVFISPYTYQCICPYGYTGSRCEVNSTRLILLKHINLLLSF